LEQLQGFRAPMLNRNPRLQFAFGGAKLAEGRGLGMKTLSEAASNLGLPQPRFDYDGVYLNLTIFRSADALVSAVAPAILEQLSKSERKGWAWLAAKGHAKSGDYAVALDSDERTARRHLNHFLELRLVRKSGSSTTTEYIAQ
jgi:ATP-dependent DNA helicase RecG